MDKETRTQSRVTTRLAILPYCYKRFFGRCGRPMVISAKTCREIPRFGRMHLSFAVARRKRDVSNVYTACVCIVGGVCVYVCTMCVPRGVVRGISRTPRCPRCPRTFFLREGEIPVVDSSSLYVPACHLYGRCNLTRPSDVGGDDDGLIPIVSHSFVIAVATSDTTPPFTTV